jgi:DNA polymerase III alpha subunit (gram-positive type)
VQHTGITNEFVANCRNESDVLLSYFEWVVINKPDTVIGHNYKTFDGQFFDMRAQKFGLSSYKLPIVDTLEIARQKKIPVNNKTATGKPSYKQESLAEYYGIVYKAHSAIEDVRALIEIYKKMTAANSDVKVTRQNLGF